MRIQDSIILVTKEQDWQDCSCKKLAFEGLRLCKTGQFETGIAFLEAAVAAKADDLNTLSIIYRELGHAYSALEKHNFAVTYDRLHLTLARILGRDHEIAIASGNLAVTLKNLQKYDEAIACCLSQLVISKRLSDRIIEASALYNLAYVYQAKGKQLDSSGYAKEFLLKAVVNYEAYINLVGESEFCDMHTLMIAKESLGHINRQLGKLKIAKVYYKESLAIAKQLGDKPAEGRVSSNLGDAHVSLNELEAGCDNYRRSLQIAKQLGDIEFETVACHNLGNTYTLLRDYEKAMEYHLRHLHLVHELNDSVSLGKACWSLMKSSFIKEDWL